MLCPGFMASLGKNKREQFSQFVELQWGCTEVRASSTKRKPVGLPVVYGAFLHNKSKEEVLRASERSCMFCLSGKFHYYTEMIKRTILYLR